MPERIVSICAVVALVTAAWCVPGGSSSGETRKAQYIIREKRGATLDVWLGDRRICRTGERFTYDDLGASEGFLRMLTDEHGPVGLIVVTNPETGREAPITFRKNDVSVKVKWLGFATARSINAGVPCAVLLVREGPGDEAGDRG